ncbi:uncharacterized protein LOC111874397 [Cryptotermes secundus]|uniref:uncharacterized protein LOC111874397 n=1 Tax=Cryptotermes secundus TaxID=105785 RepID=UPI000CD7CC3A|nr:uncharacterized protein LOC111874397 [Cryptotermes secundus]
MLQTKILLLVVTTSALFLGTCAAPYLLLQPRTMSWAWPTNSYPPVFAVFALHRGKVFNSLPSDYVLDTVTPAGDDKSALPSSGIDVYYVPNTAPLGVANMYDLPSGDGIIKSNRTVTTHPHALIPTLGDVIEFIPFLPVEINVPNVISSMMNFFSWMINRRPQDQTTPRIYFVLKK